MEFKTRVKPRTVMKIAYFSITLEKRKKPATEAKHVLSIKKEYTMNKAFYLR